MKDIRIGLCFILSGAFTFSTTHLATVIFMNQMGGWSGTRYFSALYGSNGIIPYILGMLLFIEGMIRVLSGNSGVKSIINLFKDEESEIN